MIGFWGGTKAAKFIPFRGSNREAQFIEYLTWEAAKIAIVLQLSPQDLGLLHARAGTTPLGLLLPVIR